jgi:hypothetical protein
MASITQRFAGHVPQATESAKGKVQKKGVEFMENGTYNAPLRGVTNL